MSFCISANVRRYVALAQSRGGACFCRLPVIQVYTIRLQNCRVGKNRDTLRESPAGAGAARTAGHLTILFSQKILAVRSGNDTYRPVRDCSGVRISRGAVIVVISK